MIKIRPGGSSKAFGRILCAVLIVMQSCSSANRIVPSEYSELGEIDSKKYKDYRIQLRDGTSYTATDIAATDSLLTIIALSGSDDTRNNVSISEKLPYCIPLSEIESIESRREQDGFLVLSAAILFLNIAIVIIMDNYTIVR